MLRFHNTFKRGKEEFQPPDPGKVGIYTCGPTVHDYAHIGNFRAYVWEDLLCRYLRYRGYRVTQIMNITDVDDKTIRKADAAGCSLKEFTERYTRAFFEDLDTLGLRKADHYPCATDHIPEMVRLVQALTERGFTYSGQGSIYYRIAKFPEYGKLARLRPEELRSTGRAESDEYDKQDVRDFALWKKTKEGEPSWKTEIGVGRPGWHLECSAMSMHYLGESFDLHTGGVDNIFPHHENEIAQSEAATGKPFVRSWLHCAHLMVNGEKMSKSLGNFFTLRDLLDRQQDPMAIRYLLLSQHYRKPLNFTLEGIRWAAGNLVRLEDFRRRISSEPAEPGSQSALSAAIRQAGEKFHAALDDDLNTSAALAAVFDLIRVANTACDQGGLREDDRRGILDLMKAVEEIFGIPLARTEPEAEAEILSLIEERTRARMAGDFRRADEIRDTLAERGIVLEDTPGGVRWKRPR